MYFLFFQCKKWISYGILVPDVQTEVLPFFFFFFFYFFFLKFFYFYQRIKTKRILIFKHSKFSTANIRQNTLGHQYIPNLTCHILFRLNTFPHSKSQPTSLIVVTLNPIPTYLSSSNIQHKENLCQSHVPKINSKSLLSQPPISLYLFISPHVHKLYLSRNNNTEMPYTNVTDSFSDYKLSLLSRQLTKATNLIPQSCVQNQPQHQVPPPTYQDYQASSKRD
eukprot:TRINITY_DN19682_c0_g1_i2.p1 TRINITY_DN19682_c0_g1~~TRINITY_DN19682_c0_g1_i2.p1  ORF type:complete len:222 (+),score=-11.90 TRINITY_DN19682_c0_g1_i2:3-668(+)